jgi:hypothetical protein
MTTTLERMDDALRLAEGEIVSLRLRLPGPQRDRPQTAVRIPALHRSTFCHHFVAVLAGILISPRVRSARIAEFA